MMKGLMINEQTFAEENMSNITSASGEASLSSSNRNDNFSTTPQVKRKRNQAGNPDPEAEVIALSPRSLMATNRFVCEICGKGFQRDQNLQLHRRGHNLPWKLKKRANNEVIRKKVYVCPESSCIHHDPTRALGDLTGIKKHFCRKHGEKKWKCEKCSKRYAVQSDWKAHSKTCGTKEYRCECGTLFSRRDSFITHRAFCDTLAVESGRSSAMLTGNNPISLPSHINLQFQQPHYFSNTHDTPSPLFSMKKEEQPSDNLMNMRHEIPPWLMSSQPLLPAHHFSPPIFQTSNKLDQDYYHENDESTNPNMVGGPHEAHVSAVDSGTSKQTGQFGLNLSSREELTYSSGRLGSYKAATTVASGMMMTSFPFADDHGFAGGSTFEDAFTGFTNNNLNSKKENEDMTTKDFLSLRHDHSDIFNIAGLVTSTHQHPHFQNHKTWDN